MPNTKTAGQGLVPVERIEQRILLIHGHNVMVDSHLAELYQVRTFRLNEAVKRIQKRFPEDFMFQLTKEEAENLRSQIAISSSGYGGRRYLPYVFTEQGVALLLGTTPRNKAEPIRRCIARATATKFSQRGAVFGREVLSPVRAPWPPPLPSSRRLLLLDGLPERRC